MYSGVTTVSIMSMYVRGFFYAAHTVVYNVTPRLVNVFAYKSYGGATKMSRYNDKFDTYLDELADITPRYTTLAQTQYEYDGRYSQDDDAADYIRVPHMFTVVS